MRKTEIEASIAKAYINKALPPLQLNSERVAWRDSIWDGGPRAVVKKRTTNAPTQAICPEPPESGF